MIIVVTNRCVRKEGKTVFKEDCQAPFGDKLNTKSRDELRIAIAKRQQGGSWQVDVHRETADMKNPPSQDLFAKIIKDAGKKGGTKVKNGSPDKKKWLFFVHGYNQSFLKNLDKCHALEKIYGVNVIAFSWPSNPGGSPSFGPFEYRRSRANAWLSSEALERTLKKLSKYVREQRSKSGCDISLSFMSYSLGNYLLELIVSDPCYDSSDMGIFDNIVLCQPDVDVKSHRSWVSRLACSGRTSRLSCAGKADRVYVTINEVDCTLNVSGLMNFKARLGSMVRRLRARHTIYFDFTGGENVRCTHGVFYKKNLDPTITDIFQQAFTGGRPEEVEKTNYVPRDNTYRLKSRKTTSFLHILSWFRRIGANPVIIVLSIFLVITLYILILFVLPVTIIIAVPILILYGLIAFVWKVLKAIFARLCG